MDKKPVYDMQKKNRARTTACIRGLISIYLVSLAWTILKDCYTGESDIALWIGVLIAAVFVLAAAMYGVSTWRRYKRDLEAAEMSEEELERLREKYPDPVPEPVEYDEYLDDYLDEDDDEDDENENGDDGGDGISPVQDKGENPPDETPAAAPGNTAEPLSDESER